MTTITPSTDQTGAPPTRPENADTRNGGRQPALVALLLIGLGLFFLAANFWQLSGGIFFVALGLAFLVARVTTGRYGLAVPAGILLGFGAFVALEDTTLAATGADPGGWFFVMLGLGFLAVYIVGGRLESLWPLIPAAILADFGLILLGAFNLQSLAQFAWMAQYWPLVLIGFGLWLVLRDRIPPSVRLPAAIIGVIALLAYAQVAIGAVVAANTDTNERALAVGPPLA